MADGKSPGDEPEPTGVRPRHAPVRAGVDPPVRGRVDTYVADIARIAFGTLEITIEKTRSVLLLDAKTLKNRKMT